LTITAEQPSLMGFHWTRKLVTVEGSMRRIAEDGQRRDAFVERDVVLAGDVEIGIHMADVYVDQYEVGLEDGQVLGIVEVDVKHLAIAAPVAAKVEQDALVALRGSSEGCGHVGFGLRGIGIDRPACGAGMG
jgi:hypothetical protein